MIEPARVRIIEPEAQALPFPAVLHSSEFIAGFRSPDYLLDGVLQRGFLYSLTGQTGAGKTTITLRLLAHAAQGKNLGAREMSPCRCLMLVGENADDVRARWIALSEQAGFVSDDIDVHFVPGIFSITSALPYLKQFATDLGGVGLLVVDTSAAYFEGEEENSNKQLGDHARALRQLTELHGRPCVIANCHPTKGASEENLLPRGGGAFIAEVDGNLTCAKKDGAVELHWQGKFRGPDFEPLAFELVAVNSDQLRDTRGRYVPSVIARPLSQDEQAARADVSSVELRHLLVVMADNSGASISTLADHAGWTISGGAPHKSKVARLLGDLKRQGFAEKKLGTWALTPAGEKAAKQEKSA